MGICFIKSAILTPLWVEWVGGSVTPPPPPCHRPSSNQVKSNLVIQCCGAGVGGAETIYKDPEPKLSV